MRSYQETKTGFSQPAIKEVCSAAEQRGDHEEAQKKRNVKKKTIVVNLQNMYEREKNEQCFSHNKTSRTSEDKQGCDILRKNASSRIRWSSHPNSKIPSLGEIEKEISSITRNNSEGTGVSKDRNHQRLFIAVLKPFGIRILRCHSAPTKNVSVEYLKKAKLQMKANNVLTEEKEAEVGTLPLKAATVCRLDTSENRQLKEWLHQKNLLRRKKRAARRNQKRQEREEKKRREQQKQERAKDSEQQVRAWMERKRREASVQQSANHLKTDRGLKNHGSGEVSQQPKSHDKETHLHCGTHARQSQCLQAMKQLNRPKMDKLAIHTSADPLPQKTSLIGEGQTDSMKDGNTASENLSLEYNMLSSKVEQEGIAASQPVGQISSTVTGLTEETLSKTATPKPLASQNKRKGKPTDTSKVQVMRTEEVSKNETLSLKSSKTIRRTLTDIKVVPHEKSLLTTSVGTLQDAKDDKKGESWKTKKSLAIIPMKPLKPHRSENRPLCSKGPDSGNKLPTSLRLSHSEWLQRKTEEKKNEEKHKKKVAQLDPDLQDIIPKLARRRIETIREGKNKVDTGIPFNRSSDMESILNPVTRPKWVKDAKLNLAVEQQFLRVLAQNAVKTGCSDISEQNLNANESEPVCLKSVKSSDKCKANSLKIKIRGKRGNRTDATGNQVNVNLPERPEPQGSEGEAVFKTQ
ncbi:probable serine/threonine-protein kinase pkgA [Lepisosteus oculatus]|uniref:probable serine/threonine-protein kinase pkgA n=1 Tax=Lepisosteus oculatus TaxID=7918 RepID=UPI0037241BE1